jgi:hypothetical protein
MNHEEQPGTRSGRVDGFLRAASYSAGTPRQTPRRAFTITVEAAQRPLTLWLTLYT